MQTKRYSYKTGDILPDGRKIMQKERTGKTDYRFLLFCNVCKTQNWVKRTSGLKRQCVGCNGKIWKYETQEDRVANKSFTNYKYRANKMNNVFSLTRTEFLRLISQECYWCGFSGKVGIDRLDNTKGYTIQNSVACCKICNYAKNDLPIKDWIDWVNRISQHNSGGRYG